MRRAEVHVPSEAIAAMGFDVPLDGFRGEDVRDVTLVSCGGRGSVVALTFSGPVDDALADANAVEWWERLDARGTDAAYLCRVVAPDLPDETPGTREREFAVQRVTVEGGGCTLTLVASHDVLRRSVACDDVPVSLRRLTDYEGPQNELDALTRRQREVLETAYDLGYYEVPREATADEVARRLDLDRSTVTEHLQRAERNLLSAVLSG